jgi:hypothetical protein
VMFNSAQSTGKFDVEIPVLLLDPSEDVE